MEALNLVHTAAIVMVIVVLVILGMVKKKTFIITGLSCFSVLVVVLISISVNLSQYKVDGVISFKPVVGNKNKVDVKFLKLDRTVRFNCRDMEKKNCISKIKQTSDVNHVILETYLRKESIIMNGIKESIHK